MKKQKKANKKQNKCKEKAKQTGPQGHPLGNGPPLSRKAAFGTWAGGLCQPPTLSWKSMCPFKCWCRDRNPNRTETHSCTDCMWGKFKNPNAWKPGNRDCISCTPPKCESSGCPKAFSAICVFELAVFLIYICFALRFCICIFCAFLISFFCIFFLQLLFVCTFQIHFFCITVHAAFFQDLTFLR